MNSCLDESEREREGAVVFVWFAQTSSMTSQESQQEVSVSINHLLICDLFNDEVKSKYLISIVNELTSYKESGIALLHYLLFEGLDVTHVREGFNNFLGFDPGCEAIALGH